MAERIAADARIPRDIRTVADLTAIYCRGHHRDRERPRLSSIAADLGVYGRRPPRLCAECAEHVRYAEERRALCPRDPKPFCAHCDTSCYREDERLWQRNAMRYSGPRSMYQGHAIQGTRHLLERLRWQRRMKRAGRASGQGTSE